MQLNIMSHFKLTHDLMPLLRKSERASVVVTSSAGRNLVADFQQAHDLDGTKLVCRAREIEPDGSAAHTSARAS